MQSVNIMNGARRSKTKPDSMIRYAIVNSNTSLRYNTRYTCTLYLNDLTLDATYPELNVLCDIRICSGGSRMTLLRLVRSRCLKNRSMVLKDVRIELESKVE